VRVECTAFVKLQPYGWVENVVVVVVVVFAFFVVFANAHIPIV